MKHFAKDVTTAGTAERLIGEDLQVTSAVIQAKRGNTGNVFLGGAGVDNSGDTGTSLAAGEAFNLSLSGIRGEYNLETIFIDAETSGEGVTVTYFDI